MSYIRHNVNIYLLFLILFTATSLVGATVFFQQKFDSMVNAYDSQIGQMNGLAQELSLKQSALQDAERDLELRQAREEKLNQINQKLASSVEQPKETIAAPTAAVTVDKSKPVVRNLATSVGEGFLARPKKNGWAFMTA